MGLPARKQETRTASARPSLRVVKPVKTRKRTATNSRAAEAAAQRACRIAVAAMCLLSVLGIGRVTLTVRAAEVAREKSELQASIKDKRYEGEMLEVSQSALGSPSRIQAIAGEAMDLAPAKNVAYLNLNAPAQVAQAAETPDASSATTASAPAQASASTASLVKGALASLVRLSAGEAQVLLVGDVGIAQAE